MLEVICASCTFIIRTASSSFLRYASSHVRCACDIPITWCLDLEFNSRFQSYLESDSQLMLLGIYSRPSPSSHDIISFPLIQADMGDVMLYLYLMLRELMGILIRIFIENILHTSLIMKCILQKLQPLIIGDFLP